MTKHERKLKKKVRRIEKEIKKHLLFKNWERISVKIASNKIHLKLSKNDYNGNPKYREVDIGMKDDLNLNTFLDKFRGQ